tara:strand:- start:568 stop:1428 length:861 start_codon:yes stop_codon:yes gene_type:complete
MARRKNSGRLGVPENPPDSNPPIASLEEKTDNLFSFVLPTEFVDLPSEGLQYEEGHVLHGVSTIEIRHMTAKEEDILSSESLLKKGVALDRLLQSVVVDKSIQVNELLVGDKNALLIAARITGFGPHYDASVTCPSCYATVPQNINLEDIEIKNLVLPSNVTPTEDGNYDIWIEKFDLTITVRLLKGSDEKKVSEQREKRRKLKQPDADITTQLSAIIVAVNGQSEPGAVRQFIEIMPSLVSRQIRAAYDELVPNLDLTVDYECEACSYAGRVGLPMSAEFFWPGS